MITCTKNNFGCGPIEFQDFQSDRLCVLNGKFVIDTESEEYKAAERLEIKLPDAFRMKRSAVSTAILISSSEKTRGTVLRCRIDKGFLCIEKLTHWDEEGPLTIIVAAGFTVLGWHGQFTETDYKRATFGIGIKPDSNRLVVKDDFVYASISFSSFPSTNNGYGPFSIKINEMPEDVDAIVPVSLQSGTFTKGQIGTWLGEARIQGGYISMNLNENFSNYGGQGSFFIFFAPRHQFIPRVPGVGKIVVATDDVTCGYKTTMESLLLEISDTIGLGSLELKFTQYSSYEGISFYLAEYPDYAKYEMKMPVLSRGGSYSTRYTVAPQVVSFSEYNKSIALRNLISSTTMETSIFDASIISDIIFVNDRSEEHTSELQ